MPGPVSPKRVPRPDVPRQRLSDPLPHVVGMEQVQVIGHQDERVEPHHHGPQAIPKLHALAIDVADNADARSCFADPAIPRLCLYNAEIPLPALALDLCHAPQPTEGIAFVARTADAILGIGGSRRPAAVTASRAAPNAVDGDLDVVALRPGAAEVHLWQNVP